VSQRASRSEPADGAERAEALAAPPPDHCLAASPEASIRSFVNRARSVCVRRCLRRRSQHPCGRRAGTRGSGRGRQHRRRRDHRL